MTAVLLIASSLVLSDQAAPAHDPSAAQRPALATIRGRVVMEGEWETKDFLEAARQDAVRVSLQRGGTESVALKVG